MLFYNYFILLKTIRNKKRYLKNEKICEKNRYLCHNDTCLNEVREGVNNDVCRRKERI